MSKLTMKQREETIALKPKCKQSEIRKQPVTNKRKLKSDEEKYKDLGWLNAKKQIK